LPVFLLLGRPGLKQVHCQKISGIVRVDGNLLSGSGFGIRATDRIKKNKFFLPFPMKHTFVSKYTVLKWINTSIISFMA